MRTRIREAADDGGTGRGLGCSTSGLLALVPVDTRLKRLDNHAPAPVRSSVARSAWPADLSDEPESGSFPPSDHDGAQAWIQRAVAERWVERLSTAARQHQRGRVREAAIEALRSLGDPSAGPAVVGALRDEDGFVRCAAVTALAEVVERETAVSELIPVLRDDEASVRARAAHALIELGDQRAVEPLLRMLHDEPPGSAPQRAAAVALEGLKAGRMRSSRWSPVASPVALWAVGVVLFSLGVVLANAWGMGFGVGAAGLAGFFVLVMARLRAARDARQSAFFHPAGELGSGEAVWLGAAADAGGGTHIGDGDAIDGGGFEL